MEKVKENTVLHSLRLDKRIVAHLRAYCKEENQTQRQVVESLLIDQLGLQFCEGCNTDLTGEKFYRDSEGIELCKDCWKALCEEAGQYDMQSLEGKVA